MPAPRLVDAIQQAGGWQQVTVASSYRVVSAAQARVLLQEMAPIAAGVAGHGGSAIAGRDQPPHAWFLGTAGPHAVAVLVERSSDPDRAIQIGAGLLQSATTAH
ncbi:MAG: hypothetical protein GX601_09730 [Anaerolineales bacterium]|nr:hypothetical protein [Anaerolineales bacterium]